MGSRLDRITDWESRARRAKYRVARLARGVATTPRQLERYFLEAFARHPKEWMEDLLMQDALRLMRRRLLAKEIALRLGFKHVSSFCRAFRQRHGASLKSLRASRVIRLPQMSQKANKCREKLTHFS
jgi:AraC-like DNA-binding protein